MSLADAVTWDVARAAGLTALALLSASMAVGLLVSLRVTSPRWPRFLTTELHRSLSLLSLVFLAVHVAAVWASPFTRLGFADVLVPLASSYERGGMAVGIVGLDLVLAVWVTTLLRRRLGYRTWRRVHGLAFGAYVAGYVHALMVGSDPSHVWALAPYVVSLAAVGGLTAVRVVRDPPSRPPAAARGGTTVR